MAGEKLQAKQFLVKKPYTYNGRDIVIIDGKVSYKTSTVTEKAKKILEKINESLTPALRCQFEEIKDAEVKAKK